MTASTLTRLGMGGAALALLAAASATAAIAGPATAHHSSATSDRVTFVVGGNTNNPTVIANGAISAAGKDDPNHRQYDVLHFNNGSMRIEHPNKQASFTPTIDHKTCFVSFKETGKFTLDHGTGAYAGIAGSGTYHGQGYSLSKRTAAGKCSLHSKPTAALFTVTATGTVH